MIKQPVMHTVFAAFSWAAFLSLSASFDLLARADEEARPIVGRTFQDSQPAWKAPPQAPPSAPHVVYLVLDDVGYAQLGCYGSAIETPNIDRLAAGGLRYTNFHTTAICAPSRVCLLTGINHHANHYGTNFATGYPGYDHRIPRSNAMIPEILKQAGYNTFHVGKWHLTPVDESSNAGPFHQWPLGMGFQRFYGFVGGETNQWFPHLAEDNHHIETPTRPGYHLTEDLTDQAIRFITEQRQVRPDKPFFLSLAYSAAHAPLHVHKKYIEKYRGKFDKGWDMAREETFARQKKMGIVPAGTVLPPRNPTIKAWDELNPDERRLFTRLQELFAGYLTHCDENIGRLIKYLQDNKLLDNTLLIVTSDNGASQEGRLTGSFNEQLYFNNLPENWELNLKLIDELGGPTTYPHYPLGWAMAGNTPLKRYKQNTHAGGNTDPLIMHWPRGISDKGSLRPQYHHLIDITPTVLDLLGMQKPKVLQGADQRPFDGVSMAYSFKDAKAPSPHRTQYYEMLGHRAIYHEGWKAVAYHERGVNFDDDQWELYNVDSDFSESNNLAAQQPAKLAEMMQRWWTEAGKYDVAPLDDRGRQRANVLPEFLRPKSPVTYLVGMTPVPLGNSPGFRNRSYSITAEVGIPPAGAEGVLLSAGGRFAGFSFFIQQQKLHYVYNYVGLERYSVTSNTPVPSGKATLRMDFTKTAENAGTATLFINGKEVGSGTIAHTVPITFGASEGVTAGRDPSTPVTESYASPFPFTGTLTQVVVDSPEETTR